MIEDLNIPEQPTSAPILFFEDDERVSYAGYIFKISDDNWQLSRGIKAIFPRFISHGDESINLSLRTIIAQYAVSNSSSHACNLLNRFKPFYSWKLENHPEDALIEPKHIINYRDTLLKGQLWYIGVLSVLFSRWIDLELPGLSDDMPDFVDATVTAGNEKGAAVSTKSPTEGPLTDLELQSYDSAMLKSFEDGTISLSDFGILTLFRSTGRRAGQISDIVACDLITVTSTDGLSESVLQIPRGKQRGGGFRKHFKPFALDTEVATIIQQLIVSNNERLSVLDTNGLIERSNFPLFARWENVENFVNFDADVRANLPQDYLHCTPAHVSNRCRLASSQLSSWSERTNSSLNVFPTRLRRTLATRAAREGYGELVIAELLDHSDTQQVKVYTENVPENVDAINRAVAQQLAPLAQAFAGKLIQSEAQATRGDDPTSRIYTDRDGCVGSCGQFGFCGALAPIACYTCREFEPWLDGPHREVLEKLLASEQRISSITNDKTIGSINRRTILAVNQVVQLCDARKAALGQMEFQL